MDKKSFVKYLRTLGIEVHTTTKARGHHGFFCNNRIDISKNLPEHKILPTMIHEFAHYIHYKLEPDMPKTGGTFEVLFKSDNPIIPAELFKVTNFVDENSLCIRLVEHRERVHDKIVEYDRIIKKYYPKFLRSKKFKEFDKYIKHSDAKYLLKYDRVRVKNSFFGGTKDYSISTLALDFPQFDEETREYLLLKSKQRMLKRVSSRINRLNNYYKRPTELFARFVEALFVDTNKVTQIAPYAYLVFCKELTNDRFLELAEFINKFF